MSTRDPNVQGIRRDYKELLYRALPGKAIITADLPASQLRIASIVAQDEHLIEAIKANKDLHRETAARLFEKSPEEVTDEERQIGKTANFQLLFGSGVEEFQKKLNHSTGQEFSFNKAKKLMKAFLKAYPGIDAWQARIEKETRKAGQKGIQVNNLSGKKIFTREYNQALNYAIAGSEAEIMKSAATYFGAECRDRGINAKIINMVHDSIVVETAFEDKEVAVGLLKEAVEQAMNQTLKLFRTQVTIDSLAESPIVTSNASLTQAESAETQESIIIQENNNENNTNDAEQ